MIQRTIILQNIVNMSGKKNLVFCIKNIVYSKFKLTKNNLQGNKLSLKQNAWLFLYLMVYFTTKQIKP